LALSGAGGLVLVSLLQLALLGGALFETDPWTPSPANLAWTLTTALACATTLTGIRLAGRLWQPNDVLDRRLPLLAWICAVTPLGVVSISPRAFDYMSREDHPVELLSAAANIVTAGLLLATWRRWPWRWRGGLLLAATGFFIVGMEEISWFQRLLQFDTPTGFEANEQGEANLHNFATDAFQSIYYVGATVLMVVVPFAARCLGRTWPPWRKALLVPGRLPMTLAVAAVPYNYAESTYLASHISFWLALAALALWPSRSERTWCALLFVHVCVAQAIMFAAGPHLLRDWAPSEYRELFIAAAFLAWGIEVRRRVRSHGTRDHTSPELLDQP
jgi:hypothetical protein